MSKALSLNPADAVISGAGINEGDFRVVNSFFIAAQNPASQKTGDQEPPACKLRLTLQPLDRGGKPVGDLVHEDYKVGVLEDFAPSIDGESDSSTDINGKSIGARSLGVIGKYVIAVGSKSGLTDQCALMRFLNGLCTVGFDRTKITSEAAILIGLEGHFLKKEVGNEGYKTKVLFLDKPVKFPYEAGAVKTVMNAAPASTSSSASASAAPTGDVAATAMDLLRDTVTLCKSKNLTEATITVLKKEVNLAAMKNKAKYAAREALVNHVINPDFLLEATAESVLSDFDAETSTVKF